MSEQTVTVLARVKAKSERLQEVQEMLMGLIGPTREEPGCISYALHQSADDECSFVFVESWANKEVLDEHLQKPYVQAFLARADEILADPLDVTLWHQIVR